MSTNQLEFLRKEYPGLDDESIAKAWGIRFNLVAIVRYKSDASGIFDCFGCCTYEDKTTQYLQSPSCHDAHVIWDGQTEQNLQLRGEALADRAEIERFQDAAYKGDLKQLKYFLAKGYSPTLGNDIYKSTALISAIHGSQHKALALLLQYPCDLEHEEINDHTALMRAAEYSDLKAVNLLIKAGADVTHENPSGFTALHFAAGSNVGDRERDPRIVERLVAEGANPDAANVVGITPLSWAIEFGHTAVEQQLRKSGAQIAEKKGLPAS